MRRRARVQREAQPQRHPPLLRRRPQLVEKPQRPCTEAACSPSYSSSGSAPSTCANTAASCVSTRRSTPSTSSSSGGGSSTTSPLAVHSTSGSSTCRCGVNASALDYYCPGPDKAHVFTAPTSRTYNFSVQRVSGSTNMQWYMTTTMVSLCSGVVAYQSPWWDTVPGTTLNAALTAGQSIYLIVDNDLATESGTYTITVN